MTLTKSYVGLRRDAQHRYYWGDGPAMPGVTATLKMLDKSGALVGWAKRETAACAVRNLPMLEELVKTGGQAAAINWLKSIPDYQRDTSADLGTRIHVLAEARAKNEPVPASEEELPFLLSYEAFLDEHHPTIIATEFMVANLELRYGGTADALMLIGDETWLIDYKTGGSVYPETALQLAGLAHATFMGHPDDPEQHPIPRIDRFGVLHLRPGEHECWDDQLYGGQHLIEFAVGPQEWAAFRACRALWGWANERAQGVMA